MEGAPFQQYRNVFRGRNREDLQGFPFCDDGAAPDAPDAHAAAAAAAARRRAERRQRRLRPLWEEESAGPELVPLIEAAVGASSTDDDSQSVHQVLRNDRGFWSSAGSDAAAGSEWLLFRLRGPLARAHYVRVAVYRALYQAGHPVYPPQQLQAWVGASLARLRPAGPWLDVLPSDALQTFPLWRGAEPGKYLLLVLRGKQQLQREDRRWYTAIRYVGAVGTLLLPADLCGPPPVVSARLFGPGAAAGGDGSEEAERRPAVEAAAAEGGAGASGGGGGGGRWGLKLWGRRRSREERPVDREPCEELMVFARRRSAALRSREAAPRGPAAAGARASGARVRAPAWAAAEGRAPPALQAGPRPPAYAWPGVDNWEQRVGVLPANQPFHESLEEWYEDGPPGGGDLDLDLAGDLEGDLEDESSDDEGGGGGGIEPPYAALARQLARRRAREAGAQARGAAREARDARGAAEARGRERRERLGRARPEQLMHLLLAGEANDPRDLEDLIAEILQDPPLGLDPAVILQHQAAGAGRGRAGDAGDAAGDGSGDEEMEDEFGGGGGGGGGDGDDSEGADSADEDGGGGGWRAGGRGPRGRLLDALLNFMRGGRQGDGGDGEEATSAAGGALPAHGRAGCGGAEPRGGWAGGGGGGAEPEAGRHGWAAWRAGEVRLRVHASAAAAPFALLAPAPGPRPGAQLQEGGGDADSMQAEAGAADLSEEQGWLSGGGALEGADPFGEGVAADLEAQAALLLHACAA